MLLAHCSTSIQAEKKKEKADKTMPKKQAKGVSALFKKQK